MITVDWEGAVHSPERLAAGERSGLVGIGPEDPFDRLIELAVELIDVSCGVIALVDSEYTTAMSAVDVALWDLKGKHYNEPIHRLLGGKLHDHFNSYAAVPFGQDGGETQAMARRWIKSRYSGVKFGG